MAIKVDSYRAIYKCRCCGKLVFSEDRQVTHDTDDVMWCFDTESRFNVVKIVDKSGKILSSFPSMGVHECSATIYSSDEKIAQIRSCNTEFVGLDVFTKC